jgi:regulatory protein
MSLSLEARALGWLARREYSRADLRRRLQQYESSAEEVEALLDRLESRRLLSDQRFTESLIHRRGERFGVARLRQELAQHGVSADEAAASLEVLRASEFDRARAVWLKRFGDPPADAAERLRQMRFLAARGFSHEVIRRLLRFEPDEA